MRGRNALRLAVSASLLSVAGLAPAQQVEVQRLEEIIVTAQKREERLRDVPQSVTALTAQSIERLQVNDFSDYVTRVPGLTADTSQPGSTRLTLRGLNAGGVASTIGTYVDETPFGSSSGLANGAVLAPDLDPFDVERIEVLRGPQGTLYGASTLGGLLKFVTRAPSPEELEFRVQATGESTEDGDESVGRAGARQCASRQQGRGTRQRMDPLPGRLHRRSRARGRRRQRGRHDRRPRELPGGGDRRPVVPVVGDDAGHRERRSEHCQLLPGSPRARSRRLRPVPRVPREERCHLRYLQRNDRLGSRLGKPAFLDELQRARPG